MSYETLLYEVSDGIAQVTMNRPKVLNALDEHLTAELADAFGTAAGDDAVRCVVVTGAGRAFSSGADLAAIKPFYERGERPPIGQAIRERYNPMVEPLLSMEKPTVAMVNGIAAGAGCSLALACDFRIASDAAAFLQAFIRVGLIPDSGATYLLPRLVGVAKALELAMLGEAVPAEEALRIGLVTRVVPADALEKETREFASRLATGPTRALGLARKAIHFGAVHPVEAVLDYEADLQDHLAGTADHTEGVTAFLEKRPATFQGR